jgi:GNAT superfamily N-acetyltransferase
MSIRLRSMRREDIPRGVELLAQLGYVLDADELALRMAEVAAAPRHALIVAEIAGRVAALLHVFARPAVENPMEAIVQSIVVDAECRRGGVGRHLMQYAEAWGREQGCRSVALYSNVARAPAHAFYAALGYDRPATAHVFRKKL